MEVPWATCRFSPFLSCQRAASPHTPYQDQHNSPGRDPKLPAESNAGNPKWKVREGSFFVELHTPQAKELSLRIDTSSQSWGRPHWGAKTGVPGLVPILRGGETSCAFSLGFQEQLRTWKPRRVPTQAPQPELTRSREKQKRGGGAMREVRKKVQRRLSLLSLS